MELQRTTMFFLVALALSSSVEARSLPKAKNALIGINPPLKDVSSDKKFFGPPFPADYPDDKRPVVQKSILDKIKGPNQPYPALQGRAEFDADYVKDENSDTGAWKAQFEYDTLRRKLMKEEADEAAAQSRADSEGKEYDDASKKAGDADKGAADAESEADAARKEESDAGTDTVDVGPPSEENLEKLKKKVDEAEANYAKEQKDFEECKKQLENAKKEYEELKAQLKDMEAKLADDTALWLKNKTMKMHAREARIAKVSAEREAKRKEVDAKVQAAQKKKTDMDQALAKEKSEAEAAKKNLDKEKADVEKAKKDLDAAALKLQKLRGYTPQKDVHKSGAAPLAGSLFVCVALFAAQLFA